MYLNKIFKYLFVILLLLGITLSPVKAYAEEVDETTSESTEEQTTDKVIVTIDVNGGVELDDNEFEINKGALLNEVINNVTVTNENTNKEFDGFYDSATDGNKYTGDETVNESITIFAHWKDKEVTNDPPATNPDENNNSQQEQVIVDNSSVRYSTHVQDIGWQNYVSDGAMAGTSGRSLRLEGIRIEIDNNTYTGNVLYRTHIQNIGWETSFKKNGEMSGTSGKSYRLEAIEIKLDGELAEHYDIYYRVHCQSLGWLGWARNGERSGSAGYSYRLEGIEIKLIEKGTIFREYGTKYTFANSQTGTTTPTPDDAKIAYTTHVQEVGWQSYSTDGVMAGTSGRSLRLEGIKIKLLNPKYTGDVIYRTHIESIGWESSFKKNDEMSGTSGRSLRLEAIEINLTGEMAEHYDIYYRVHAENFGWLGWARNGERSGTSGYSYRLEGIEIQLIEKGTIFSGYGEKSTFIDRVTGEVTPDRDGILVTYSANVEGIGWQKFVSDGALIGTTGQSRRIEALKIRIPHQKYSGNIEYASHIQSIGWETTYSKNGEISGTTGRSLRLEAIKIKLTGEMALHYDVYYRTFIQNIGWMAWVKNDIVSGTAGKGLRIEALEVKLVEKDSVESGFVELNGKKYYYNEAGEMIRGFLTLGMEKYLLDPETGELRYGWICLSDGKIYYANSDGIIQTGATTIDGNIFSFTEEGVLNTGWQTINGKKYYYYADGTMAKYMVNIGGIRYEFSSTGELQHENVRILADVSYHNGTINFDELWASGEIDGIIFRIGWSLGMDRKFTEYLSNAKRLGIPYSVYHFSIAENAEEAAEEGRYLVNWYKNNNVNAEMGVFYDLEEWHNEDYSHSDATITPAAYDSIIQSYKQVLNDNGISVSVYAGKNFAETRFTDYGRSQVQWIAQYNTRCTYGGTYRGWQFTSTATLPGINGNVDLSIFYY